MKLMASEDEGARTSSLPSANEGQQDTSLVLTPSRLSSLGRPVLVSLPNTRDSRWSESEAERWWWQIPSKVPA